MFKRDHIPVWVGILMMASFFLVGQDWSSSATGGGLHVIDAEGNDVGIAIDHNKLFDTSRALFYRVDFWTGQTDSIVQLGAKNFESDDCTGPWYPDSYEPGLTLKVVDDPTFYVVTASGNKNILSVDWGGCFQEDGSARRVGTEFSAVTPPSSFPAPLRYEVR
jgi:hypothetical protein